MGAALLTAAAATLGALAILALAQSCEAALSASYGRLAFARLQQTLRPLPTLLLVFVAYNFPRMASLSLSIDDENSAFRRDPGVWLSQGRWGIYWIERWLVPTPTMPFVPDVLCGAMLALAYLLLVRLHGQRFAWLHYLLFPLFCASPALLVLVEFYGNTVATGAGYLLVALALVCHDAASHAAHVRQRWLWRGGLLFSLAAAVACYQAFVLVFLAAGLGIWTTRAQSEDAHVRRQPIGWLVAAAKLAAQAGLSLLVYKALQALHIKLLLPGTTTPYLDHFLQLNHLRHPAQMLRHLGNTLRNALTGHPIYYGAALPSFAWLSATAGLAILGGGSHQRSLQLRVVGVVAAMATVLAGFGLHVATGGHLPLRCCVALPYLLWWLGLVACSQRLRLLRGLGLGVASLAALQLLVVSGQFGAEMQLAQHDDAQLAAALYNDLIHARPDFDLRTTYAVDIYGKRAPRPQLYPTPFTATTSASFFDWDEGNTSRMLTFMRLMGANNVRMVSPEERQAVAEAFSAMPNWPNPGAVRWVGEVALIKLSAEPGIYHRGS